MSLLLQDTFFFVRQTYKLTKLLYDTGAYHKVEYSKAVRSYIILGLGNRGRPIFNKTSVCNEDQQTPQSSKTNHNLRECQSYLGRVFNFKLDSFTLKSKCIANSIVENSAQVLSCLSAIKMVKKCGTIQNFWFALLKI